MSSRKLRSALGSAGALAVLAASAVGAVPAQAAVDTATPIKHLVVLFDENVSFDHYFATYPQASNAKGESLQGGGTAAAFTAAAGTPKANTLTDAGLLTKNPNAVAPFRLTPEQAVTCDQNHAYGPEQQAYDGGKMDKFVESVSKDKCASAGSTMYEANGLTMGYYDGNTVTGLWNYAQNYAMSDNSFSSTFGPSTPGALNLISGQTHGVRSFDPKTNEQTDTPDGYAVISPDADGVGTVINDPDPVYDDCSNNSGAAANNLAGLDGKNIGELLNAKGVSWGWFQGGFAPSTAATDTAPASCMTSHENVAGAASVDYSPHHNPFAYYKSTSNEHHVLPANDAEIGHDGAANHNYDLSEFDKVVNSDNMPAVSYLKAAEYQDGHAAYSDPVDEQHFLTKYINMIQKSKNWKDTAVVVAYDDSDGWYDHQLPKITNGSTDSANDSALCTSGPAALGGYADRCGPGTRQPLLVISPYSKTNYIDHTQTETASILKFVEDNWKTGRIGDSSFDETSAPITTMFDFASAPKTAPVLLDESNGAVLAGDVTPVPSPTQSAPATTSPSSTPADSQPATPSDTATPSEPAEPSDPADTTSPSGPAQDPTTAAPSTSASSGTPVAGPDGATPSDTARASGPLANTGATVVLPIVLGAVLLLAGVSLWLLTLRRRSHQ